MDEENQIESRSVELKNLKQDLKGDLNESREPSGGSRKISTELKLKILKELLEPHYYDDVSSVIHEENRFYKVSWSIKILSNLLVGAATMMIFASGYYSDQTYAFASGGLNTGAMVTDQFSNYAGNESQKRNRKLNLLLRNAGIGIQFPSLAEENRTNND